MLVAYRLRRQWGGAALVLARRLRRPARWGATGRGPRQKAPRSWRSSGPPAAGPANSSTLGPSTSTAQGNLVVVDRTGRIQVLTDRGAVGRTIDLPVFEKGYPVGVTAGPDGLLYVADTHYQRVLVYDKEGRSVRSFGEFGTGPGQFIYPTDVALAADGRMFVSEYGGNDRVSIFSAEGSSCRRSESRATATGNSRGPQALAVDEWPRNPVRC